MPIGTFVIAALLFLSIRVHSEETCKTYKLNHKGFSSTYLPLVAGDFVRRKAYNNPSETQLASLVLSREVIDSYLATSLAERVRAAIKLKTRREINIAPDEFFNSAAEPWKGKCHQWANAVLNPEVGKVVEKYQLILCGPHLFTNGDLREAFTALHDSSPLVFGDRTRTDNPSALDSFVESSGISDLDAHTYDQHSVDQFEAGQGFTIDVDMTREVYNHPVVAMQRCESSVNTLDESVLSKLPLQYLQGTTQLSRQLLANLQELEDAFLLAAKNKNLGPEGHKRLRDTMGRIGPQLGKEVAKECSSEFDYSTYGRCKELVQKTFLTKMVQAQEIVQVPDIELLHVRSSPTIMMESTGFAKSEDKTATFHYSYLIVKDKKTKKILNSRWTSRAQPDFM